MIDSALCQPTPRFSHGLVVSGVIFWIKAIDAAQHIELIDFRSFNLDHILQVFTSLLDGNSTADDLFHDDITLCSNIPC
jgi:hypothetical protein